MQIKSTRRFIAEAAIRSASTLNSIDRAAVLEEAAKLLSGDEREHALAAAFALRKSEEHQLKLTSLLQS